MYDIDKGHVSVEEVHDIIKEEDQAIIEEELIENKTEREKIIKNASDIISDVKWNIISSSGANIYYIVLCENNKLLHFLECFFFVL